MPRLVKLIRKYERYFRVFPLSYPIIWNQFWEEIRWENSKKEVHLKKIVNLKLESLAAFQSIKISKTRVLGKYW